MVVTDLRSKGVGELGGPAGPWVGGRGTRLVRKTFS